MENKLMVKPFTLATNFQFHWPKDCKLLTFHYSEKNVKIP